MGEGNRHELRLSRIDFDLISYVLTCLYTSASTRSMASPQAEAPKDGDPLTPSAGCKRVDGNTNCAESPDMLPV